MILKMVDILNSNGRIQPEAGKLIIFPATWDFGHLVIPKTETKYLVRVGSCRNDGRMINN